jgi:hypothetical protein
MLIVWVPSTVNRVYGVVTASKDGGVNFALNLAAAAVLPLQGMFNAFVFCFTSRVELLRQARKFMVWRKLEVKEIAEPERKEGVRSRNTIWIEEDEDEVEKGEFLDV